MLITALARGTDQARAEIALQGTLPYIRVEHQPLPHTAAIGAQIEICDLLVYIQACGNPGPSEAAIVLKGEENEALPVPFVLGAIKVGDTQFLSEAPLAHFVVLL
ncbi:MAG: hypothetical protein R6W80_01215 [Haliea sp.]